MDPGDQILTLDDFTTWKLPALRDFLTKRGLSKDGCKKELTALCFAACSMKLPLVDSTTCILKQNELDYEKLLHVDDGHIPDPLSLHTGWADEKRGLSKWPPVYITDIVHFLVTRQSSTAVQIILNDYKIGKAYEYFQSGHLQEVYDHSISNASCYCILSAKCTPSQKMRDDSHTVWICCCKETGEIKSAYCTCTAGLGSTCNHVAGLLFRVEAANKMGIASCTSVPCAWDVPSGRKLIEPCQLKNMTIRKSRYGETGKRPLISRSKSSFDPVGKDVIDKDDMLHTFVTALKDVLPNSCLKRGTVHESKDDLTKCMSESPGIDITKYTITSLLEKCSDATTFIETLPTYSEVECRDISSATIGQGENPLWHDIRQDRLTSSNFYSVHTKMVSNISKETNMEPLLCNMLGYRKINPNIKPIKHGRELEPEAKQSYKKYMSKSFHSKVSISECGIYLDQNHSYLGASPDLLVTCECCGDGVVEIKCPLVTKCAKCSRFCTCKLPVYLQDTNGSLCLKKKHSYYCQIQGQLAITGRKYCDLYVYTCNGNHTERILFDSSYYLQVLDSLKLFYMKFVVPELFSRSLKNQNENTDLPVMSEAMDTGPDHATTYFCPACNQVIKEGQSIQKHGDQSIGCDCCHLWYHFKCVQMNKITSSQIDKWACPKCSVTDKV